MSPGEAQRAHALVLALVRVIDARRAVATRSPRALVHVPTRAAVLALTPRATEHPHTPTTTSTARGVTQTDRQTHTRARGTEKENNETQG